MTTEKAVRGAVVVLSGGVGALASLLARRYVPEAVAFVVVGAIGAALLLANTVVKDLHDFFSAQLARLEKLEDPQRRQSLTYFVRDRRAELNAGWVIANVAGVLGVAVSGLYWNPTARSIVLAERWDWVLVATLVVAGLAMPSFIRAFRFQHQRDEFQLEITELLTQERRRAELLRELGASHGALASAAYP